MSTEDFEFSWRDTLYANKFDIIPVVRNQAKTHTCVFQASSGAAEMELKRRAALRNKPCTTRILTENFISEYEKIQGCIPNDKTRLERLPTALQLFQRDGVLAEEDGVEKVVKISTYQSVDRLDFFSIAGIIGEGRSIIGSIRLDDSFARLNPGQIYRYNPERAKVTETGEHCAHALLFIGYGWCQDEQYLVFLNSHGKSFCDGGFGRVYFDCVRNLMTIDF